MPTEAEMIRLANEVVESKRAVAEHWRETLELYLAGVPQKERGERSTQP